MSENELNRRSFLKMGALSLASAGLTNAFDLKESFQFKTPPNIVFLMADDLGIETIGAYGGTSYETKNIDTFSASGMKFTNCFSSPLCSPSRAQLLTGRYGFRTGIDCLVGNKLRLDPNKEVTLANVLKNAGYQTAIVGKWHLCPNNETIDNVKACGFEEQYCYKGGTIPYGTPDNYLPDKHFNFAIDYLEKQKNNSKPFYLQYSFGLPHFPYLPTPLNPSDPESIKNFPYMVEYLDILFGKVVDKIKELNLSDNTLIFFCGDNGTDNKLRSEFQGKTVKGGKGRLTDTGSWVPLIVSGPGISSDSSCSDLVDFCDFFPTLINLCDAQIPDNTLIDGKSFAPQLKGQTGDPREWVYVQLNGNWFIRNKEFKLNNSGELYDVTSSPFNETLTNNDSVKKFLSDEEKRIKNLTSITPQHSNKILSSHKIKILPRHSGEFLINIQNATFNESILISIFNVKGKMVRQMNINGNQAIWDGKNHLGVPVSSGKYFVKVQGRNWKNFGKLVKFSI